MTNIEIAAIAAAIRQVLDHETTGGAAIDSAAVRLVADRIADIAVLAGPDTTFDRAEFIRDATGGPLDEDDERHITVAIVGNPVDGIVFYGPVPEGFDGGDLAEMSHLRNEDWWVAPLRPWPEDPDWLTDALWQANGPQHRAMAERGRRRNEAHVARKLAGS